MTFRDRWAARQAALAADPVKVNQRHRAAQANAQTLLGAAVAGIARQKRLPLTNCRQAFLVPCCPTTAQLESVHVARIY